MPRRRRTDNKGYPTGWTWHHGALYYMVPEAVRDQWDGKRKFRLGANEHEAYKTWTQRIKNPDVPITFDKGFDKYLVEVVPDLAALTQESYRAAIQQLRRPFGGMAIVDFQPHHAYQYRNKRGKKAKTAANRECEVLSAFFTKCFEWGVPLKTHPMIEGKFRKFPRPARTRIVEEWELQEALALKPPKYGRSAIPMCQAYLRIKNKTGRRRIEILRLKLADMLPEGIRFQIAKQRNGVVRYKIVEWDDDLRAAVDAARSARPVGKKASRKRYRQPANLSPWLFCKWDGNPYLNPDGTESDAFGSLWGRFMDALLERTKITERFWDSDIRAKAADDADDEKHAQELLDHTTPQTTRKHYRRKPGRVKPVRMRPDEVNPVG